MAVEAAVKEQMLRNRAAGDRELALLRAAEGIDRPFLKTHLRRFVLFKFQLSPDEIETESIGEITDLSLAKSAKLSKELAEQVDNAKSCDGATSAMVKKALLYTALQRGLDLKVDSKAAARSKTLDDLTGVVWDAMAADPAWSARLT